MNSSEKHLDQAAEILSSEMDALRDGDLEEAHRLAMARGEALRRGCEQSGPDSEAIVRRLEELKSMHGGLMSEAQRIRERVKEDLLRLRSERQRFSGYRDARKITPMISRFVSKRS
jgi:hypothetical protein